jgi:serine protease Do
LILSQLRFIGWFATIFCIGLLPLRSSSVELQQNMVALFAEKQSAVLRIKAAYAQEDEEQNKRIVIKSGTGFFITNHGHALVCASRVMGAERLWVEFQAQRYEVDVIGHDRMTNVALLKLKKTPAAFDWIQLNEHKCLPEFGSVAFAITCPLDLAPSPVMGLFSGVDKYLWNHVFPTDCIRTSISANGGQGGCPVFDLNGELVGMSVTPIPELNGSYCLPTSALALVSNDLMDAGRVRRGWMGLEAKERIRSLGERSVYLSKVVQGAPADQAGLEAGDQLLAIQSALIHSLLDLPSALFPIREFESVVVRIKRADTVMSFTVKTMPAPFDASDSIEDGSQHAALFLQ